MKAKKPGKVLAGLFLCTFPQTSQISLPESIRLTDTKAHFQPTTASVSPFLRTTISYLASGMYCFTGCSTNTYCILTAASHSAYDAGAPQIASRSGRYRSNSQSSELSAVRLCDRGRQSTSQWISVRDSSTAWQGT